MNLSFANDSVRSFTFSPTWFGKSHWLPSKYICDTTEGPCVRGCGDSPLYPSSFFLLSSHLLICLFVCLFMCFHDACVCICVFVCVFASLCVCVCMCVYLCTCVRVCVPIRALEKLCGHHEDSLWESAFSFPRQASGVQIQSPGS